MASKTKTMLALHVLLLFYSISSVLSKVASGYDFLSLGFILCYGLMVCVLGVYAIGWQQVIKHIPLTEAYANRAVAVVWGIVWGVLLFHESLNVFKVVGAAIVLAGVALFGSASEGED